jgi:hypothetical protein
MGALRLIGNGAATQRVRCVRPSRSSRLICAFALLGPLLCPSIASAQAIDDKQMTFAFMREGPADGCGQNCREWVSASGMVTTDTPRAFADFAKGRELRGAVVALDSLGGNVTSGIWLGREFRRLGLATTVGKTELLAPDKSGQRRATLSPRAYCGSICPFILLGGVRRHVPSEAKVLVHQTWPKTRMQDAMARTYSALEWGASQRLLGQLARYTVEMGGDIGLFEAAMRVPPWEAPYPVTAPEIRRFGLDNAANVFDKAAAKLEASMPGTPPPPSAAGTVSGGLKTSSWSSLERAGVPILARQYPLTLGGEELGQFEISFACGGRDYYKVTYSEARRLEGDGPLSVSDVAVTAIKYSVALIVHSSLRSAGEAKLETLAYAAVPSAFLAELTGDGGHLLAVTTVDSRKARTVIGIGPAGLAAGNRFVAACEKWRLQAAAAPQVIRGPR